MIRFHTPIVVKVQSYTPRPKKVLHQLTSNILVEGVGSLRHREWSARVVLFPQLLEIIQIPLNVAKFTLFGCRLSSSLY